MYIYLYMHFFFIKARQALDLHALSKGLYLLTVNTTTALLPGLRIRVELTLIRIRPLRKKLDPNV